MKLREYQSKAIEHLRSSLASGNRTPVLMAPTGAGKTRIAIEIIKMALNKGKSIMFVVDMIQLIKQTSESFDNHGLDHNIIQGNTVRFSKNELYLASVQTLKNRDIPHVDLFLVDECHCMYESFTKLIQRWNAIPFIGISATPWTTGMGKIYDDLIVVESTKNLIKQGYLCNYIAYGPATINLKGVRKIGDDYDQKEIGKRATKIVGDVVDTWLRRGENKKTVCFAVNVAHSKAIVDEFIANGVSAAHIDSYTSEEERDAILSDYEAGKYKILSNVGITTKGWDSPGTEVLIYARPTKSLKLHIQILGRILRASPDKKRAIILDHGRNIERLGFPDDDLPTILCNGDIDQVKRKREEKEREEKAPKPCPECSYMHNQFKCPQCGGEPKIKPKVQGSNDKLQKLEKKSFTEKQELYSMLLYWVRSKGNKDGRADYMYRDYYGVWPAKKTGIHPKQPTQEALNIIKHLLIKSSKSNKKNHDIPHDKPVSGFDYIKQTTSDGRLQVKATLNGKYQFFAEQTPEIMAVAR